MKNRYAIIITTSYAFQRGTFYIWYRENGRVIFYPSIKTAKEKAKTIGGSVYKIGRNLQDHYPIGTYNNSFHRGKWLDTRPKKVLL